MPTDTMTVTAPRPRALRTPDLLPQLRPRTTAARSALAVVIVAAALLRFVGLAHQSLWFDEADTVWLVHFSFRGMLAEVGRGETSPPLYFVIAWMWSHVFGFSALALRSLSAVAGVLTVPVAYAAGRELFDRRAGLIAAALVTCSPSLIWYSQEARSYALMVLLTSVALLATARLRRAPSKRWTVIWGLAATLALYTHYYAGLTIVPEGVWLAVRLRHDRRIRLMLAAVSVALVPLLPLLVDQARWLAGTNWIAEVPLGYRASTAPGDVVLGQEALFRGWLLPALACAYAVALALLFTRGSPRHRRSGRNLAWLLTVGIGILVMLIAAGEDQLDARNLLALWLPGALLAAGGLRSAGRTWAARAALAVFCFVGLFTAGAVALDARLQRPDWRGVAAALDPGRHVGVYLVGGCKLMPLSLYVPGLGWAGQTAFSADEIDLITTHGQPTYTATLYDDWYPVCSPVVGQELAAPALPGFRRLERARRIGEFTITRYRASRPRLISGRTFADAGLSGELMVRGSDHDPLLLDDYQPLAGR